MDDKKKIVLATEDVFAKNLDDIFINVNLQRTFTQIKRERFDNNFDLAQQFRKERNASRSFRVYGIIDSPAVDCSSRVISVYSNSALTQVVKIVQSTPIGFGDKNVFGKQRGKYLIELNNYTSSNDIWLKINSDGVNFADTVSRVPLVFYGADGEFIEYGTNTVDIGLNGESISINNDFPFFYDKHWVKNNFQIEKVLRRNISLEESLLSINEGSSGNIVVYLNEPSVFGNESVNISITTESDSSYETAIQGEDFNGTNFGFPTTISWAVGEQFKTLNVSAIQDFLYEKNIEYFTISLSNPSNATIGQGIINIDTMTVNILNTDEKRFVKYNFQKIIQNSTPVSSLNFPANLTAALEDTNLNVFGAKFIGDENLETLNGVMIDNQNQRFYPNDSFELEIINRGSQAILSPIPGIIPIERNLNENESVVFTVSSKYQNQTSLPLETAILRFKYDEFSVPATNLYRGKFYINGIEFGNIGFTAVQFVREINRVYTELGIEIPFSISKDGPIVTLTATHPANTINVLIPSGVVQVTSTVDTSDFTYEITVEEPRFALVDDKEVPDYIVPGGVEAGATGRNQIITPQIPFEISLNANSSSNTQCRYEFRIRKPGYKEIIIPPTDISATSTGSKVFLVSGIRNVIGPISIDGTLACGDNSSNLLNQDGYFINGLALLSNQNISTNTDDSGYYDKVYQGVDALNSKLVDGVEVLPFFRSQPLSDGTIECNNLIQITDNI